jgi:transposase
MHVTTIGVNIAKRVFQPHGVEATDRAVLRRPGRSEVLAFYCAVAPCLVGVKACSTAHDWARDIRALGHEVRPRRPT